MPLWRSRDGFNQEGVLERPHGRREEKHGRKEQVPVKRTASIPDSLGKAVLVPIIWGAKK